MEEYREFEAYLDELTIITILMKKNQQWEDSPSFTLLPLYGPPIALPIVLFEEHASFYKYQCKCNERIHIGNKYIVQTGVKQTDLQIGAVVRTAEFDKEYAYEGTDLGALYQKEETSFKLWAPTATNVKVKLVNSTRKQTIVNEMKRGAQGTWHIAISGDLENYQYTFLVCVNNVWREAVDPYAKAVSINGKTGIIIDLSKIHLPSKRMPPLAQSTDAIIYETHIRDFTIHPNSLVIDKGTYNGFTESTGKTGLDYICELGVTHIELLPVNDFAGVDEEHPYESYNWGYNPLHYFAPEGSYSSNPQSPYTRIFELQKMISDIHEKGLRVIVDVVFNHVYIKEESSFEKIVPGYYFRYDAYGMPSNGTGVGNDLASERKMMRKLIIDCVLYWIEFYHVDGFRFDLMGILDVETINEVRKRIDEIDPSILLFGEGWELNTPLPLDQKAVIRNGGKLNKIGFFNDRFRDVVKGSTFNIYDRGFALGQSNRHEEVKQVIMGSIQYGERKGMFGNPEMSVNYVESHDNHTFWDKAIVSNSFEEAFILRRRQRLATCIVLLSQGIPFLHSGQEFYRTKSGDGNSYQSPDSINQLNWDEKGKWEHDVSYIQGIISIRKSHSSFRFTRSDQVRKHMFFLPTTSEVVAYELRDVEQYGKWGTLLVVFNNSVNEQMVELREKESWKVLADDKDARAEPLYKLTTKKLVIQPISCYVFAKE